MEYNVLTVHHTLKIKPHKTTATLLQTRSILSVITSYYFRGTDKLCPLSFLLRLSKKGAATEAHTSGSSSH